MNTKAVILLAVVLCVWGRPAPARAADADDRYQQIYGERLRKLEETLGVGPAARDEFRRGVLARLQLAQRRNEPLWSADPSVGEALEKTLLPSWGEAAKALTSAKEERVETVRSGLVKSGFSAECADDVIAYATGLAGGGGDRRGGSRRLRWRG